MGADDYITKPFAIEELLARIRVTLRKGGSKREEGESALSACGVVMNVAAHSVTCRGQEIALTRKEYDLLLLFARNPGTAMYRETIYERVWGGDYTGESRTVDLHIQRLRKKVGWEKHLKAVSKVGYRLEV